MATKAIDALTPNPGQIQFVDSPFQGQGLDVWKALVRNLSPYGLMIAVSTSTYWLGPYEQDYYEFPEGVYTFGVVPIAFGAVPGGSSLGEILITAFDQSSDYDGDFPVALTPPTLEQTFSLIASDQFGPGTPDGLLDVGGITTQPFDSIVCLCVIESGSGTFDAACMVRFSVLSTDGNQLQQSVKGRYSPNNINFSLPGTGTDWQLQVSSVVTDAVVIYQIYGVTISDADALMGEAMTANDSGNGTLFIEPDVRGRRSKDLAVEYTYTAPVQFFFDTHDGIDEGPDVSRLLIDDASTDTVTSAFTVPDHAAWRIRVVCGDGGTATVNVAPVAG